MMAWMVAVAGWALEGEHTEQILLELGHSWEEIIDLKERGAVL